MEKINFNTWEDNSVVEEGGWGSWKKKQKERQIDPRMTSKVEATQPDAWFSVVDAWRGGSGVNMTSQWCWEDTSLHRLNLSFFSFYAGSLVPKWWWGHHLSSPSKRTLLSLRLLVKPWRDTLLWLAWPCLLSQPVTVAHGQAMLLKSWSVLDSRVDHLNHRQGVTKRWVTGEKRLLLQGRKDLGPHNNSTNAATNVLLSAGQHYRSRVSFPCPGMEPMSLALAGGFFTTEPPKKPCFFKV